MPGPLDDLAAGRFRIPDEGWCRSNYFHGPTADDMVAQMTALADKAAAGLLAPAPPSWTAPPTPPPAAAPGDTEGKGRRAFVPCTPMNGGKNLA